MVKQVVFNPKNAFSDQERAVLLNILNDLLKVHKSYQPIIIEGREFRGGRESSERTQAIVDFVRKHEGKSLIDIGCAEGIYLRAAAREGCFVCGIDADEVRVFIAHLCLAIERQKRYALFCDDIGFESIQGVPCVDVAVSFSVFHHIMNRRGVEYSRELLRLIMRKTKLGMFFEMGQSDEISFGWAKRLPDMGSSPHQWIEEFLFNVGFAKVEKLYEIERKGIPRATFLCTK